MSQTGRKTDGWANFPLIFGHGIGSTFVPPQDDSDIDIKCDGACKHEPCGFGCFVNVIDYDELDQN